MKKYLLLLLLLPNRAFGEYCASCIQNSAAPQTAQFNISSATIRGPLTVGQINLSTISASTVTAGVIIGSGTFITNLNASQLLIGNVSSNVVSGPYPGITSVGSLSSGTWKGIPIGTQYGGTGQNFIAVSSGSIIYFSNAGVMATLLPGSPEGLLQTNGNFPPSWTYAPQVAGTNFYGIPLTALSSGTLSRLIIVSSNSIPYVDGASVIGDISGGAGHYNGTVTPGQISSGTLPTSVVASSITGTGVIPGTYGGPTQYLQITVGSDGRISFSTQGAITSNSFALLNGTQTFSGSNTFQNFVILSSGAYTPNSLIAQSAVYSATFTALPGAGNGTQLVGISNPSGQGGIAAVSGGCGGTSCTSNGATLSAGGGTVSGGVNYGGTASLLGGTFGFIGLPASFISSGAYQDTLGDYNGGDAIIRSGFGYGGSLAPSVGGSIGLQAGNAFGQGGGASAGSINLTAGSGTYQNGVTSSPFVVNGGNVVIQPGAAGQGAGSKTGKIIFRSAYGREDASINQEGQLFAEHTGTYSMVLSSGLWIQSGPILFPDNSVLSSAINIGVVYGNGSQFTGNGTVGSPLTANPSSVTLQGNSMNFASQFGLVGTSTGSLQSQVNAIVVSTTSLGASISALQLSNGVLSLSTASLQSQINSIEVATQSLASLSSTQTFTGLNTFKNFLTVSSGAYSPNGFLTTGGFYSPNYNAYPGVGNSTQLVGNNNSGSTGGNASVSAGCGGTSCSANGASVSAAGGTTTSGGTGGTGMISGGSIGSGNSGGVGGSLNVTGASEDTQSDYNGGSAALAGGYGGGGPNSSSVGGSVNITGGDSLGQAGGGTAGSVVIQAGSGINHFNMLQSPYSVNAGNVVIQPGAPGASGGTFGRTIFKDYNGNEVLTINTSGQMYAEQTGTFSVVFASGAWIQAGYLRFPDNTILKSTASLGGGGGGTTYTADELSLHLNGSNVFSALPSSVTLQGNTINIASQFGLVGTSTGSLQTQLHSFGTSQISLQTQLNSVGTSTGSLASSIMNLAISTGILSVSTGSLQTQLNSVGTSTSNLQTQLNSVGTSTGSLQSQFNTVGTSTASLQSQLNSVGTSTATHQLTLNAVAASTASLQTQLNSVGTSTGSLASSITNLAISTGILSISTNSLQTQLNSVGTSTSSIITRINAVAASTGTLSVSTSSLQTQLNSVGTSTASLQSQIGGMFTCSSCAFLSGNSQVFTTTITFQNIIVASNTSSNSLIQTGPVDFITDDPSNGNQLAMAQGARLNKDNTWTYLGAGNNFAAIFQMGQSATSAANWYFDTGMVQDSIYTPTNVLSLSNTGLSGANMQATTSFKITTKNLVAFSSVPVHNVCASDLTASLASGTSFMTLIPDSAITLRRVTTTIVVAGVGGSGDNWICGSTGANSITATTSAAAAAGTNATGTQSRNVTKGTNVYCWDSSTASPNPIANVCLEYVMQ